MSWLKKYYGADFERLTPTVVAESGNMAVVRIVSLRKQGYVLIDKTGRHNASPERPLFEGMPNGDDLKRMHAALEAAATKK